MLELAVLGAKLSSWGGAILKWAASIPWYVWTLLVCCLVIYAAEHKISNKNAEIARDKAAYASSLAAWQKVDAIDHHTALQMIDVVNTTNGTISIYQKREASAFSAAAQYKAKAVKAASARDKAIAILKSAKPVANDCAAPPEHSEVENQL